MRGRLSLGLSHLAVALLIWGPMAVPQAEAQPAQDAEIVDERLRTEEEWAAAEHARQKAALDGGTQVPIPPPGQKPKGAFDDLMTAISVSILGVIAGAVWGGRRKRKKGKKRKR